MRRALGVPVAYGRRCLTWRGWRALRYLLVWPLIRVYRDCVRRSLRWRLAESHVGTVLFSVVAVSLVGAVAAVAQAFIDKPMAQEPAREARWVAESLTEVGWVDDLALLPDSTSGSLTMIAVDDDEVVQTARVSREAQENVSALLAAMATGKVGPNVLTNDINLPAAMVVGKRLANVTSISIVGPDRTVLASSEPLLNGRSALLISANAMGLAEKAIKGSESTSANTGINEGVDSITGSYPLKTSDGRTIAAVVVDKEARTLPTGLPLVGLMIRYVGEIALTILFLIGLPAIPIGMIVGIRRARAIARPVSELAATAEAIGEDRLDARVRVEGDDELAQLGRRFNQMADRLQESLGREAAARARAEGLLAANRELVANVSHELRTPVALVRAHIETLTDEPERVDEYARIALRETDRLEALVNDLFQLARLEGQAMHLERESFDAGAAAREATESLVEPARREAGIVMRADVEVGDLCCVGDRPRLIQVLQNLIRNAIRFTPEGGIILVGARADGDAVAVTVRDTGVGIAPEDLPHVFERFYRSEQSRNRSHGGAGLGLAIARQLIEAMGGTIAVESELGEGTVFTIRLPRQRVAARGPGVNGAVVVGPVPAPRVAAARAD